MSSEIFFVTRVPSSTAAVTPGGSGCFICPLGPFTSTAAPSTLMVTPFGIVIGFFPIRDMGLTVSPYQTLQRISPPTPACLAARPVITPRDVVKMVTPSPPSTDGTSPLLA